MNYTALYRKYRPETFDGVIGQDHIVATLKNQIVNNKVSHAYLFTGTRGTGKTSTAKIFARAINCVDTKDGNPCLKCHVCRELSGNSIDIIEMDAASNNGVDYARDIREKVQFPPVTGRYKVYIIDEVHMLSQGAFNALLKTIEEPPEHAVFILCTTEVHKIPATILSRCMRFDFRLVSVELLSKHIEEIYKKEGILYDKEAVNAIAMAAEGSVRDSLSIADRCRPSKGKLTYDDVMNILGVSSRRSIAQLADAIIGNDAGQILNSIYNLTQQGKDVGRLLKDLSGYFHDILVVKTCSNSQQLLCLPEDMYNMLKQPAEKVTTAKLLYAMDCLARLEADLRFALSPVMLLEAMCLRIASSTGEVDVEGLDRRITRLEQQPKALNSESMLVVDRTNRQSIWKAVKVAIEKTNQPLFSAVWSEVEVEIAGENFVVKCNKGQYNLIKLQYEKQLREILANIVNLNLVLREVETPSEVDIDKQLKSLGNDVRFEK